MSSNRAHGCAQWEPNMKIEDIMTRDVASCVGSDSANRAAQLMWERDCGCIPVVDADNKAIGILTDRDIAMAAYTQGKPLAAIAVADVMTQAIQSCHGSESLADAEKRMRQAQVRRLPVVDRAGLLVGIISLNDLAIEAVQEKGARHPQIGPAEVAQTLADVSKHRSLPVAQQA
jgi:CBS domain-containing protein